MNLPPRTKSFKFAVNTAGENKDWDFKLLSGQFKDKHGTLDDVIQHIKQGHALCAGLLNGKWRSKANFVGSYWILSEIDNSALLRDENGNIVKGEDGKGIKVYEHQMTLEEAIAHPFIQKHCALIYTTASHKPDWHRFRLVWLLPEFIGDIETYEAMVRLLLEQLPHDPACKDGVRVFYGNTQAEFPLINPQACLPADWKEQAIALAEQSKREQEERLRHVAAKREAFRQLASDEGWNTDELIEQALTYIPARTVGSGNYDECRQVLMALVDHYGPIEAEIIAERWSPSIPGSTWNIRQKIKSFKRSGISIGTLFHIASGYGFRFPERQKQEWGEPDRSQYDRHLKREKERQQAELVEATERQKEASVLRQARFKTETEKVQAELTTLRIEPTIKASGQYIPSGLLQLPDKPGIILIDAPMGSGKTRTALKDLVSQHRQLNPMAFRGLFVPRNMLGFQSGKELKLPHHTEHNGFSVPQEVTMCLESGWKLPPERLPNRHPLLLFDEISQINKQLLGGKTCGNYHVFILNRYRELLRFAAKQGGWIVLSEDGLTNVELDFIQEASGLEVVSYLKFERTEYTPREYSIFDSPTATWSKIKNRLWNNENLVLAADSDKWLRETEQMAIAAGISPNDIWIIDSKSSDQPWAKEFARDPDEFVRRYKPRIFGYSPSVNSGVSLNDLDGHFSAMALHLVHLEPREAKQLPDRLRSDVPRFGYVKPRGASDDDMFSSCRPDLILRDLYRNTDGISKLTDFAKYAAEKQPKDRDGNSIDILGAMERLKTDRHDPSTDYGFYLKYWSQYKARETYSKLSLRDNLIQIWEKQGHNVELLEGKPIRALAKQRKDIREALDREEAIAWSQTNTFGVSSSHARDKLSSLGTTVEERRQARKRLLEDKLPGCDLDDVEFVFKAVIKDDGKFLKAAELLWLAQNPEAAKLLDRWNWLSSFSRAERRQEIVWAPRLAFNSGKAKLLHECPLKPFIDGTVMQWDNNTPEAIAVHQWAVLHSRQFKRYLRLTISESHEPVRTVNKLLRKWFEVKQQGWKGSRENRQRQYVITNLQDGDRDAILQALTERFLQNCNEKGEQVEAEPVIATRIDINQPTNCDHENTEWLSIESLEDIKIWWEAAKSDPIVRAEIQRIVPEQVLRRAIA